LTHPATYATSDDSAAEIARRMGTASESHGLSGLQLRVFAICAAAMFLDGVDGQSIAVVAPLMANDLALSMGDVGVMFATMQAGAIVGAVTFGWAADQVGRKPAILVGLALISLFTLLTAVDQRYFSLLAYRFGVGVGMAGLVPCLLALASEFSSARWRSTVVAIFAAGYPLGAAAGAFGGGVLAEHYDWQMVFYVGGILPLLLLVIAILFLPESPPWLSSRGARLGATQRLPPPADMPVTADLMPEIARTQPAARASAWRLIFHRSIIRDTLLLWAFCFFAGCVVRIVSAWLPSLLVESGFTVKAAGSVLAVSNLACTVGMAVVGWLIDRFGARNILAPAALGCAVSAVGLAFLGSPLAVYLLTSAIGFLMGMVASGSYALPAVIYPTEIRSSGIGYGAGASRLGTTLAPLLVGYLLAAAVPIDRIYLLLAGLSVAGGAAVFFLRVNRDARAVVGGMES
jgi:MFS transporter, AAHS family, 4-hydroxybenzoate transporter